MTDGRNANEAGFSRRGALKLAGAGAAWTGAIALTGNRSPADAKAPFSNVMPDQFYHFMHGDMQVTIVSDGYLAFGDIRKYLSGPSPEDMKARAEKHFLSIENTILQENITVVNTGGKLAIFDTGMGASKMFGDTTGRLPANLRASGIDPASIDAVILSHCHPDHAGGLVDAEGQSVFPNAEVVVNEADYAFWTDETKLTGDLKPFIELARANLLPHQDRLRFIKGGDEILPGITAFDAPGHTVGHTVFMLASGDKTLALTADCGHHSVLMIETPKIEFAYDTDPKLAVASRLKVWDMLATDRIPFVAFHFAWPGLSHLAKDGDAYRLYQVPMHFG